MRALEMAAAGLSSSTTTASSSSSSGGSADSSSEPSRLLVALGMVGNVISTVAVVIVNKYVYNEGFKFMIFLSFFHFVITTLSMHGFKQAGWFTPAAISFQDCYLLVIGSLGSVAFMNLNLAYNSIGFYQMSKLACVPAVMFVDYWWFGVTTSTMLKLSISVLLLGVGIATVTDLELQLAGFLIACLAVALTVLGQIMTQRLQKQLQINSMQLLYATAPYITVGMLFLGFVMEDLVSFMDFWRSSWTPKVLCQIFSTCVFAIGVNVTNYYVIGKTSPVTYQVVGHMKTILILLVGFIVYHNATTLANTVGIVIAVAGTVWYSEIKRREGQQQPLLPTTTSRN